MWREALLAQAVLRGETRGYRNHPQLERFREQSDPLRAISAYLTAVFDEATARGYSFDATKVQRTSGPAQIPVTSGQLAHEWRHFKRKLVLRNPLWRRRVCNGVAVPGVHPLFVVVEGPVAAWEKR